MELQMAKLQLPVAHRASPALPAGFLQKLLAQVVLSGFTTACQVAPLVTDPTHATHATHTLRI